MKKEKALIKRICGNCGKVFKTTNKNKRYCNDKCRCALWYKENKEEYNRKSIENKRNNNWYYNERSKIYQKHFHRKPENVKKDSVRGKTRYTNEKTGICSDCKREIKTEFHHISYEPNIFIEVCKSCHNKRHKIMGNYSLDNKTVTKDKDTTVNHSPQTSKSQGSPKNIIRKRAEDTHSPQLNPNVHGNVDGAEDTQNLRKDLKFRESEVGE